MGSSLGSWLIRLLIATFTAVFIYPAIGFACLVIGFTPSWRSGLLMLGSSLLMLGIVKWEAKQLSSTRRGSRAHEVQQLSRFPGIYDEETSPPPLSDIYYDIAEGLREQEVLINLLNRDADCHQQQMRGGHPANCRCVACGKGEAHGA